MRLDFAPSRRQASKIKIRPYWAARGLEMVFLGNRLLWSRRTGDVPFTVSGGPKLTPSKFGLVQGFGATYGSGTTDRLDGGVLPRPASGWRSIVSHYFANSTGGGGLGRIFQDVSGTGLQTGEAWWINFGMSYGLHASSQGGAWYTANISTGRWQSAGVTHDQRTVNVTPVMYLDGVATSVTNSSAASGTYDTTPCNMVWGNRASDNARNWDGLIGPTLIFDSQLTAADHAILDKNPWAVIDTDERIIFAPLSSSVHNLSGASTSQGAASGTGTITQAHVLAGATTTQAATSGTGAITQAHVLSGASTAQAATSGTGAVTQIHVLVGATTAQAAASGTGAVVVGGVHTLSGASTSQAATSGIGVITQAHVLIGSACTQVASSSSASITGPAAIFASRRSAKHIDAISRPASLSTRRRPWH